MLGNRSWQVVAAGWLLAIGGFAAPLSAHDTGFAHSRRTLFVTATAAEVQLEYRVSANADEALIEMTLADADGNGVVSAAERDRYFTQVGQQLGERIQCETVSGERAPLTLVDVHLDQALTQTYRFHIASSAGELKVVDKNFAHKPGQVRVVSGSGVSIALLEGVDLSHAERVPMKITRQAKP